MKRFYMDYNFTTKKNAPPTRIIILALKSITQHRINILWPFQSDTLGLHEYQDAACILCTMESVETQVFHPNKPGSQHTVAETLANRPELNFSCGDGMTLSANHSICVLLTGWSYISWSQGDHGIAKTPCFTVHSFAVIPICFTCCEPVLFFSLLSRSIWLVFQKPESRKNSWI